MSYKTLEVEFENGRVHPCGAETLPLSGRALLTILSPDGHSEAVKGSLADRVAGLAALGGGKYPDLSTDKSYLNDFGQ